MDFDEKLSGADLRSADLSGANLSGANLHEADLSGADLSEADVAGLTWTYETSWRAEIEEYESYQTS